MEIYHYPKLSSTNSELVQLSKKNAKSWTVIWTSHQTAGKGYAGNTWNSEPGKNIAVSMLIKSQLDYQSLLFLNQWVCLGIKNFIKNYSSDVHVKWPNDIMVRNKKVCGVLIETHKFENQLNIIIGIGLNVNQINFENLPNAGSLATEIGKEFSLEEILSGLLTEMENSFYLVENQNWDIIYSNYQKSLFRLNQNSNFKKENQIFDRIIRGVDANGLLLLENNLGEMESYRHKEIEMLF